MISLDTNSTIKNKYFTLKGEKYMVSTYETGHTTLYVWNGSGWAQAYDYSEAI